MLPATGKADFLLVQLKSSPTVRKLPYDIIEKYELCFPFKIWIDIKTSKGFTKWNKHWYKNGYLISDVDPLTTCMGT
jgi:hypothetical protein